jgi:GntR family transcriptional repressor for pyruvate dehydrogenase complex
MDRPERVSVCAEVIDRIKELARENHYGPGSKLPSEREFAEQLGVSRPTVREALRTLAVMGVLETRHGSGTQISTTGANVLRVPFEFLMILDQPELMDLYETRELLEVHLAGRAAERRTEEDLAAIKQALDDMSGELSDPHTTEANVRFHEAIAAAAHNPILERIMNSLYEGIRMGIELTRPAVRDWGTSFEIHRDVYEAIRRQNPADARRAMTIHMAMAIEELRRSGMGSPRGERLS